MADKAELIRKNYTSLNCVESYSLVDEIVIQDFTDATFGGTPVVATFSPGADGGYIRLKRSSSGTTDPLTPSAGLLSLYAKNDGGGIASLFYRKSNGSVVSLATGGGIGGSGSVGTIPKFDPDGITLANSVLAESGGNVTITGEDLLAAGAVEQIGSTTSEFLHGYFVNCHAEQFEIALPATSFGTKWKLTVEQSDLFRIRDNANAIAFQLDSGFGFTTFFQHIIPSGTRTIGNSSNRWNKLWAVDIDASGNIILSTSTKHVDSGGGLTVGYYIGGTQMLRKSGT